MKYLCNPLNIDYHYQFNADQSRGGEIHIGREAADPSMILFHGKYYIFASMNLSVWVSEDLASWKSYPLPDSLPLYDYAPDARVLGDYVYLCASSHEHNCSHFRTKDILHGPYEEIPGDFPFWDPNLFADDDGRLYFYWGCSNVTPIWGVEKDPATLENIGAPVVVIEGHPDIHGYERIGEDHSKNAGAPDAAGVRTNAPYIEGAWMNKHEGRYYLQYADPGAEFNVYNDGVYVSERPLGPFHLQKSNPFSYKPGGFLPGAGHGSTMQDRNGGWWHASTMRISRNFAMERRVGLWPAGFDPDGELFCNQRYGDWPMDVEAASRDPWTNPKWFLMSYGTKMRASSHAEGKGPELAADENVQTWWQAASNRPGEWLEMDLGEAKDVHLVQINFADDVIDAAPAGEIRPGELSRWIDDRHHVTRWKLEGSLDGETYFLLEDKSCADTDLPHDIVVREEGVQVRFLRLTVYALPYHQKPAVSGLRVFGIGTGSRPAAPAFTVERTDDLDMVVTIEDPDGAAEGFNILWGESAEKLYHSWMIFGRKRQRIGALVKGETYCVRVDAFNENGITEGKVVRTLL